MTDLRRLLGDRRVQTSLWLAGAVVIILGYRANSGVLVLAGFVMAMAPPVVVRASPSFRYRRTVGVAIGEWQQALLRAQGAYRAVQAELCERLRGIPGPGACADAARRLAGLMDPERAGAGETRQRALRQIADDRQATEIVDGLAGRDPEGGQALAAVLEESRAARAAMTQEHERALSEALARIEPMAPPRSLADAHARLTASLRTEYIGLSSYNDAQRRRDAETAATALEQLMAAREVTRAAAAEIREGAPSPS